MKFVFTDKTTMECDIISQVLDTWNVRYRLINNPMASMQMFDYVAPIYDIEINVDPEFFYFLKSQVEKAIMQRKMLENCFNAQCIPQQEHDKCLKHKKNYVLQKVCDKLRKYPKALWQNLLQNTNNKINTSSDVATKDTLKFKEYTFYQLPKEIQELLQMTVPIEVLQQAKFLVNNFGIKVIIEGS